MPVGSKSGLYPAAIVLQCRKNGPKTRENFMIKLIGLLDRRDDLTLEQFSHHWRTTHRELALRLVRPD
jgi:hypothetical protein